MQSLSSRLRGARIRAGLIVKVRRRGALYTTHYEWVDAPDSRQGWVRYYLDAVDLTDRAHPRIGARVNVPGLLVGGDASDPSVVYTIDYRWNDGTSINDLDVLRIQGGAATLLSQTPIDGWSARRSSSEPRPTCRRRSSAAMAAASSTCTRSTCRTRRTRATGSRASTAGAGCSA
jgi:hypothetical protein